MLRVLASEWISAKNPPGVLSTSSGPKRSQQVPKIGSQQQLVDREQSLFIGKRYRVRKREWEGERERLRKKERERETRIHRATEQG